MMPVSERDAVLALARAEIRNDVIQGGYEALRGHRVDPVVPLVMAAFDAGVRQSSDAAHAIRFAVDSMSAQPDPLMRSTMMATVLTRYPAAERQLTDALAARGIPDPEQAMAALAPVPGG
jgi:hypothetical protein